MNKPSGIMDHNYLSSSAETFFFRDSATTKQLDLLIHLSQYGDPLLLITGEYGSGKSCYLKRLQSSIGQSNLCCQITAHPLLSEDQLITQLAELWQLMRPGLTIADLHQSVANRIESLGEVHQHFLLLIDDTHVLPASTLAFLVKLTQTDARQRVHLVLAGEPQLSGLLSSLVDLAPTQTIELQPLSLEQTRSFAQEYMEHRGDLYLLSEQDITLLWKETGGLPGELLKRLNAQPSQSRETHTAITAKPIKTPRRLPRHFTSILLLIIALTTLLLLQEPINRLFAPPETKQANQQESGVIKRTGLGTLVSKDKIKTVSIPIKPLATKQPPAVTPTAPKSQPTQVAPPPIATQEHQNPGKSEETDPIAKIPQEKLDAIKQARWLLDQAASNYTIQLLGAHDEKAILQYIDKNQLGRHAAYFQTTHNGGKWYALLYGLYPDRIAAVAAMTRLPPHLQKTNPWARGLANIHKDLRTPK